MKTKQINRLLAQQPDPIEQVLNNELAQCKQTRSYPFNEIMTVPISQMPPEFTGHEWDD